MWREALAALQIEPPTALQIEPPTALQIEPPTALQIEPPTALFVSGFEPGTSQIRSRYENRYVSLKLSVTRSGIDM